MILNLSRRVFSAVDAHKNDNLAYDTGKGMSANPRPIHTEAQPRHGRSSLENCVRSIVRNFIADMGDCQPDDLYRFVISEVEKPLLAEVMDHCDENQSRAAQMLGINRQTLRRKLIENDLK